MIGGDNKIHAWCGSAESRSIADAVKTIAAQDDVRSIAVMPDAHGEGIALNGIVVATGGLIYPELIGADIGCGYCAMRLVSETDALDERSLGRLLSRLPRAVPTIIRPVPLGGQDTTSDDGANSLSAGALATEAKRDGRLQLGTLGRGNHFIELDLDDQDRLWVLVHSGSRAMGQAIFRYHVAKARSKAKSGLIGIDAGNPAGLAYWSDMEWGLRYAKENRRAIMNSIVMVLEESLYMTPEEDSYLDCQHNFGRIEIHDGVEVFVHRKSANSAALDEVGIVAGSMSAGARIVKGRGNAESLRSSAHGAGRSMSRAEAFRRIRKSDFLSSMRGIVFDEERERFLRDEAPRVYRNLDEVMKAQRDLVITIAKLRPILNDKRK